MKQRAEDNILSAHNAGNDSAYVLAFSDIAEVGGVKIKPFYKVIIEQLTKNFMPFKLEDEIYDNIVAIKVCWPKTFS